MDLKLLSIVSLRGLVLLLGLQNQGVAAVALNRLISGIEAGMNVDAYMQDIAKAFETDTEAGWDEIIDRIDTEVNEFLSRGDDGKQE